MSSSDSPDQTIADALADVVTGDRDDLDQLIPAVYDELRKLAHGYLRGEPTTQTLQTTALVHDAYIRLAEREQLRIGTRTQFFALAGQVMRHLLMDYGRKRQAEKRLDNDLKLPISTALEMPGQGGLDLATLVTIDDAIRRLETVDPRLAEVVVLRFYSGLSLPEIAKHLKTSLSTVRRSWETAKQWLAHDLDADSTDEPDEA